MIFSSIFVYSLCPEIPVLEVLHIDRSELDIGTYNINVNISSFASIIPIRARSGVTTLMP